MKVKHSKVASIRDAGEITDIDLPIIKSENGPRNIMIVGLIAFIFVFGVLYFIGVFQQ